ncbi:MAG: aminoglycoside phosphotransferase family protein [Lachnospiraceae bacterium]|nr:aminoglycoside phosphotransferase family protein [Lachnospiraceae bacterium]
MNNNIERKMEAANAFALKGQIKSCEPYGSGHINHTFLLLCEEEGRENAYILQQMNHDVFKDIDGLMKNVKGVTSFLRHQIIENHGDPDRETLNLIPTKDGQDYYQDSQGYFWRTYLFISQATCYNLVEKPEDFYQSGKAFGRFQCLLADFPADELTETIPNFHNTPSRFADFQKAVEADVMGRASEVQAEIRFIREREQEMGLALSLQSQGKLPLRVSHNDTKLNNIMIDDATGQALCIIDLDTIMPGFSIFDYGDSIRFGANTAEEDEQDLSKVSLSLPLFDIYTKGFLEGCKGRLTEMEMEMLPYGAKMMTLECGMRFLADYLAGDIYFHVSRDGHNLDRCRTQLALVADMERKWEDMKRIVKKYTPIK